MSLTRNLGRRTFQLLLAAASCLLTAPLEAQFNLGTITGAVVDSNGGAVSGCAVKIVGLTNAITRSVKTNSAGLYTIPSLSADTYQVTVEAAGFQSYAVRVEVSVDQTVTADFKLTIGSVSQQVEVSGLTVELERDSHEIIHVLATQQLQNLPASGRSYVNIAASGPGAQRSTDAAVTGPWLTYNNGGNEVILSGQVIGTTTFLQDGVVNMNILTQTANIVSSIDSIQEVSIESSGMSARFPSPGLVNVISKRGTNTIHGTLYDYLENDALNAKNFFALTTPVLRYNQFGGNVGAPILKNKLFAFFDYAGQRQHAGAVANGRVPTAAERTGDFSADGIIYDPATFTGVAGAISPFPNNTIPANRISPFATQFLNFLPPATGPVVGGINYTMNLATASPYDQYLGRVDYNISSKDTVYAEFQTSNSPLLTPNISTAYDIITRKSGTNFSLQDIHIVSPNLINVARVGYNRSNILLTPQALGTQDFVQEFGLKNLSLAKDQSVPPQVNVTGTFNLTYGSDPQGGVQNLFQYADEVNWTKGKHQIFFGVEVDRIQFNGTWQVNNGGSYTFNGQYVSNHAAGAALKLGPALADFMLGFPSASTGGIGIPQGAFRESDVAGYFQDTWKVLPKLTVNLGIRYEFYQPPSDKWGRASVYDLVNNTNIPGAWKPNYKNFGPRAGFAYSIAKNTVIRSGFGIYYNSSAYQYLAFLVSKLPILSLQNVAGLVSTPVPVTNVFVANPPLSAETPFAVLPRMPTSYTEQWNFGIQHAFGSNLLATVTYVGNGSHDESLRFDPNQAVQDVNPLQPTPLQSRRPFPWVGDVTAQYNMANANYNGLQSTLAYRFSHGLSFQANYTWSKAMDISDAGATVPVNGLNAKESSYGPANFNRAQVFAVNYTYELPFGAGKPLLGDLGWASNQIFGGWVVSGITTAQTGTPFEVLAADTANTGVTHTSVANRTCNGNLPSGQRSIQQWFQTSCFTQPQAGRLGNSGRDILIGPGATNFDLSAFKRFAFGEKRYVQFRTDFFNAFNHPQFLAGASQQITLTTYGRITNAAAARLIQMSLQVVF